MLTLCVAEKQSYKPAMSGSPEILHLYFDLIPTPQVTYAMSSTEHYGVNFISSHSICSTACPRYSLSDDTDDSFGDDMHSESPAC